MSFTWQHKKTQLKTGYFQRGDGRARDFFIVDAKQKVSPKFELVSSYIKDFGVDADGGARSGLRQPVSDVRDEHGDDRGQMDI